MKPFSLLLVCMVIAMMTLAQAYNKDSVLGVVKQIRARPVDTQQVRLLRELGYNIGSVDSALSFEIIRESLDKSIGLKDQRAITSAYRMLGLWYSGVGEREQAMDCYRRAQAAAQQGDLPYLEAGAYFNMGNVKYYIGEYDSCIYFFQKTETLFERPDLIEKDGQVTKRVLDKKKSDLYSNISSIFNTLGNYKKSDAYIDKALTIAASYQAQAAIAQYTQQKADNLSQSAPWNRPFVLGLSICLIWRTARSRSLLSRLIIRVFQGTMRAWTFLILQKCMERRPMCLRSPWRFRMPWPVRLC